MQSIMKSLVAGLAAAIAAAIPLVGNGVTLQEGLIIAGAFVATQQATYWTPNKDKEGVHQDESVQPPNA